MNKTGDVTYKRGIYAKKFFSNCNLLLGIIHIHSIEFHIRAFKSAVVFFIYLGIILLNDNDAFYVMIPLKLENAFIQK